MPLFSAQKIRCTKAVLCSANFYVLDLLYIILRQAEYVNTEICNFLRSLVSRGYVVCYRISDVLNDYELLAS